MLNLMTHSDFEVLLSEHNEYYKGRWEYFSKVIEIISTLSISRVLEIGPGYIPIVKNADLVINPIDDQFGKPNKYESMKYSFDATTRPWPINDKKYDLLIALQVWEHLDNKQPRAFREAMRISKRVILSFPFNWDGGEEKPSHRAHRNIDRELINDWTLGIKPELEIEIPRTGVEFSKGPKLICYWVF